MIIVSDEDYKNNLLNVKIETTRTILQSASLEHAEDILNSYDDDIIKYMETEKYKNIEEVQNHINLQILQMKIWNDLYLHILDKNNISFMWRSCVYNISSETPEITIRIARSFRWQKYWYEIISWLKWRLETNIDYKYLLYKVDENNIPSIKIAEFLWWKTDCKIHSFTKKKWQILNMLTYKIYPIKYHADSKHN